MPDRSLPPVLGSLQLCAVRAGSTPRLRRALGFARDLERLGVAVALPIVHDLGLLLSTPRARLEIAPRRTLVALLAGHPDGAQAHAAYLVAIGRLAADETIQAIAALDPSDDLVVALLARLLADPSAPARPTSERQALASADLEEIEAQLPLLFDRSALPRELAALRRFIADVPRYSVMLDTLDLDTLRLLSIVGAAGDTRGAGMAAPLAGLAQVELLAALGSLQADDVVGFSLELLPSALEARRRRAPGTWAVGGLQGLTRRGSIDSMVLTELAWDDELLARRMLDDEVLFHSRERAEERAPRVHLLLVDASASMRGDRTTFARGVAIALATRLELEGDEVRIRFFDRRLYEPFGGRGRGGLAASLPRVLTFRGERGRNPERVLRQLLGELDVLRARERRSPVVHLVTHAAFYASRATALEVRARAALFAVFITPRPEAGLASAAPIDLEWLDVLDGHWTVDQATIAHKGARAVRGKELLAAMHDAARERHPTRPTRGP